MQSSLQDSLLSLAQGEVLEIGVGTGLNLAHYRFAGAGGGAAGGGERAAGQVERVVGIDLSPGMLQQVMVKAKYSNNQGRTNALRARL